MTQKLTIVGVVVAVVFSLLAFLKPAVIKELVEKPTGAIEFNTGKVVFSELAESVLQRKTVELTAAQVDNLRFVPIVLIPAVGDNKLIVVDSIVGMRRFSSESWSRNAVGDSFEVKWGNNQTASAASPGMAGAVALGASFSTGFLTGGVTNSVASPELEIWRPGVITSKSSSGYDYPTYASSSAVYLTGAINPNNTETSGITDFVFEVVYRVFSRP